MKRIWKGFPAVFPDTAKGLESILKITTVIQGE
jgi:hypothetical protein